MSSEVGSQSSSRQLTSRFVRSLAPIADAMFGQEATRDWRKLPVLTLLSLFLHLLALGAIGLIVFTNPQFVEEIFTTMTESEEPVEPIVEHSLFPSEKGDDIPEDNALASVESSKLEFETKGPIAFNISDGLPQLVSSSADLPGIADIAMGNEMSGRMSLKTKRSLVENFGGTTASEAAVVAGLKWIAQHQFPDGSWTFEHSKHPDCKGQCPGDGFLVSGQNGATGLALLAFLGAGHTHFSGEYQPQVRRALDFLHKSGKSTRSGLDFRGRRGGNDGIYIQGLCTIALCECAAMTRDTRLRKDAQEAVNLIVSLQNKTDGGWRYYPGQPGDTSVVGWQVMALKSAQGGKLDVPGKSFKGAERFLDLAQTDRGTRYVYVPGRGRTEGGEPSLTAVGLLCRMYLGWNRANPKLAQGVQYLDELKPSIEDMYYNYYATQVMHHWGGEEWKRWNEAMREHLINTQRPVRNGHLAGSWDLADFHGASGGRLYMTCLCVMTLEVYYRHLPLYDRENLKVEF